MSIASEISRLQQAKADIKTAIENKGVTVPSSATLDTYDDYIDSIQTGGGGIDWETIARGMLDGITQFDMPDSVLTSSRMASSFVLYHREGLLSCTIPSGTTSIGNSFFTSCTGLTSITIPNTVTSIGTSAFQSCTSLTSVTLGSSVTTLGQSAFQGCSALTSITIPASVTSVGVNFMRKCSSLTEVIMQPTSPPTLGANGFLQTDNLTSIYVPDASLSAYQGATNWTSFASKIKKISDRPSS